MPVMGRVMLLAIEPMALVVILMLGPVVGIRRGKV